MRWQILREVAEGGTEIGGKRYAADRDLFDDGIWAQPGETGFTTEHVERHLAEVGGQMFSFVGMSVVANPAMEEDIAAGVTMRLAQIAASQPAPEGVEVDDYLQSVIDAHGETARADVLKEMGVSEA